MTTHEVALIYARKRLRVIPVARMSKKPILSDWTNEATLDGERIGQWFENTDLNIGIVTGKTSGVVVIDMDIKPEGDGMHSISDMESKLGSYLPPTVTSKTQSGGIHLWFKYPSGVENIRGKVNILPFVDIRADGNQVVVYPSKGTKGDYEWIRSPWEHEMAQLPKAWKQFLCGEFDPENMGKIRIPKRAFTLPETIPSGLRHATLLSYASSLSTKRNIKAIELSGTVREANATKCNPPITDEDELTKIIDWAVDKIGKTDLVVDSSIPDWVSVSSEGKYYVDDGVFVSWYKNENKLVCINGQFYKVDGAVDSGAIKQEIQNLIAPFVTTSLSAKVNALFDGLKNECYIPQPVPIKNVVHTKTASLKIDESGIYDIETGFTLNRLDVEHNPKAKAPQWKKFLHSLLEDDDVLTLQEYVGYCLVPTTLGQKALFLIGRGGEGKSVVGEVLQALFKNSMVQGELHHLQDNRFMLAQLENKLVFYDDDLQTSALTDTGTFKKLVTASIPVLVERKGEPHYEMLPYARIIASGNKGIEACYDHSEGFYRRLIVLRCKEKEDDRVDDRLLAHRISQNELSGILNWALSGLQRLMSNNWTFSLSDKALENLNMAEEEGNNLLMFLRDDDAVTYGEDCDVTSGEFYDAYLNWCDDNALKPLAMRTVSGYLRENVKRLDLEYTNRVIRDGRPKRGFRGLKVDTTVVRVGRFKLRKEG